jgi:hypothetical protein
MNDFTKTILWEGVIQILRVCVEIFARRLMDRSFRVDSNNLRNNASYGGLLLLWLLSTVVVVGQEVSFHELLP